MPDESRPVRSADPRLHRRRPTVDDLVEKMAAETAQFISDTYIELALHGRAEIDVRTGRVVVSKEHTAIVPERKSE